MLRLTLIAALCTQTVARDTVSFVSSHPRPALALSLFLSALLHVRPSAPSSRPCRRMKAPAPGRNLTHVSPRPQDFGWKHRTGLTEKAVWDEPPPANPDPGATQGC